jgi:hypothetical protein
MTERANGMTTAQWSRKVAGQQWQREAHERAAIGDELPPAIATSRALAEVHRLDLALIWVFEDAALRVSGALVRRAPDAEALQFSAQQTIDEAHHAEQFGGRLAQAEDLAGARRGQTADAILIPPLRRFIDHCYEVADGGGFIEPMVLTNLVLEGMAYPLYSYEARYWRPIDPYLARIIDGAFIDETRHVTFGGRLVDRLLRGDPARRARVARQCAEARTAMAEIFTYYVKSFVGLFDAVARRHPELFGAAEFMPGRRIVDTPYADQVAAIHHNIRVEHDRLLGQAGLLET